MPTIHLDHYDNSAAGDGNLTLWELAGPTSAAQAAVELYGSSAATAAAWCALTAHFDGRKSDYRFWCTVFVELSPSTQS